MVGTKPVPVNPKKAQVPTRTGIAIAIEAGRLAGMSEDERWRQTCFVPEAMRPFQSKTFLYAGAAYTLRKDGSMWRGNKYQVTNPGRFWRVIDHGTLKN